MNNILKINISTPEQGVFGIPEPNEKKGIEKNEQENISTETSKDKGVIYN